AQIKQTALVKIRLDDPDEHVYADWQASSAGQELIGLHLFPGDNDVVDTGDAAVGALLQLERNTLGEGRRIDVALSALHQKLCPLAQLTRGLASHRVLDHRTALWTGSIAADPACL